jgi:antitoxin (DNA-binding transcriptional repressor) of toxin-antitoxin stability system
MRRKRARIARNRLLLTAAEHGHSTIITRHGRPAGDPVPAAALGPADGEQQPLTALAGSGRGFWGKDSARALCRLRDEWSR